MTSERDLDSGGGTHAGFPSQTHWTLIRDAGDSSSPEAQAALNQLCQTYWFPIYAFIRRKGNDSHKAKDLTQSFFVRLLEKDLIKKADRQKGKFRTFLCACLQNFLIDDIRSQKSNKVLIPIPDEAESDYGDLPPHEPDPTKLFDRIWAATVVKRATEKLKADYGQRGRPELYEALKPCLSGKLSSDSYPEVAAKLGMTKETFEVNLSRFKKDFGKSIRSVIGETVEEAEIDNEIQYLMSAWASHLEDTKRGATELA